jgi:hypothetical protein
MVVSPVGLGTKNHCAGEGQQQFTSQSVSYVSSDVQVLQETSAVRYDASFPAVVFNYTSKLEISRIERCSFFTGLPTIYCDIVQGSYQIPEEERVKKVKLSL